MDNSIQSLFEQARRHESRGQLTEALQDYRLIVVNDRNQPAAWIQLSILEQALGQYRATIATAMGAARAILDTRQWEHLSAATHRLLQLDEGAAAHDLIMAADWSTRGIARQSASLGQQLWLGGYYADALRLIDSATPQMKPNAHLLYLRGNVLRHLGRLDEATACYEQCIALAPDYAAAHWSLAHHVPSTPRGVRIPRIQQALLHMQDASDDQVDLLYALFREFDDAGDTAAAWHPLARGAMTKRRMLNYDPARADAGVEALLALATQLHDIDEVPGAGVARSALQDTGPVPVFVVGMPRTGTTLLERILGNHADVASGGELNDFASALSWESDHFNAGGDDVTSLAKLDGIDLQAVGARYLARTARHVHGRRWLLDKNPANFLHAPFIAAALPQARILCLDREPMDACFSNFKESFAGRAYPYSYALPELAAEHARFRNVQAHWQTLLPGQFKVVSYEALVADPEAVAREVMAFCAMPWQPGCSAVERNTTPSATASASQVRHPISDAYVGGWRRYAERLQPLRDALDALET